MEKVFTLFTCFAFDSRFCRSPRMPFLPGGLLPAFRPRWCAGCVTSPEDISHSDGRSIFKEQRLLQEQFNEKTGPFPYIQKVGNRAKKRRFPRLWMRKGREDTMQVKTDTSERIKDLRVEKHLTLEQLAE